MGFEMVTQEVKILDPTYKVVKVDDKKDTPSGGKQAAGSSTTSGRQCFKC